MDPGLLAAARAAEGFGLTPERIEPVEPGEHLLGGTTHRTYQLRAAGRTLYLKRYGLASLARAETEARLLLHLQRHPSDAYRTPTPLHTLDGAPLHRSLQQDGPGAWLLTEGLPGEKRLWHDFSEGDWRALGAALADLHTALTALTLPGAPRLRDRLLAIDPRQEQDHLIEHAQQVLRRGERPAGARRYFAGRQRILDEAAARSAALRAALPEQPLHNDYNQHNFLFQEGLPPAVLDWERACLGPPEYEVVRCVNVACLAYPARAAAFVEAYRARRPLDAAGLRFGVAAFLLQQATKHWPVAAWLDGREEGGHLERQFEGVALLSANLAAYDRFYAALYS